METKTDTILVIGLTDHADGMAYENEKHLVPLRDAFTTALTLLTRNDHVCMIDDYDYISKCKDHDYASLAPFSINISLGTFAHTGKLR